MSMLNTGQAKNRLFLSAGNFATANGRQARDMSKDSDFCLENV